VLIALEEVADHPEIVLSRREILFASLSAKKAMVVALLHERDHLEIENLRLQVELDRYKKHHIDRGWISFRAADDLIQLRSTFQRCASANSPPGSRSVETRSGRKNCESAKTSFPSCESMWPA